ncbi:putative urate catabolism protein [Nocardia otitidiscaviarum]|uniref:Putative urate catabolism protein n=1 Tax=Nocardia otitidiscaviarum TaxID=1823 RepID=A0A378YIP9_9NOCA|nr:polysaccharide deacetylase family protein [Nocardia otitidiscaviarum]MBF6235881.1 polysaccharide deacetylase family protein [Nocardia otitidiscaviarum]SUA76430.1 putative urate catabolism protein [Nocardia otitidiscaviarum]
MSKDVTLFDYSPITGRDPLHWPDGKSVAFYVGLNIEHFYVDLPGTATYEGTTALTPDALNYGWRDYGPRVGIWRVIQALDTYGIRASALLNSDVGERYPQIIAAGRERGWAWLAHGSSNSHLHTGLVREEERTVLREIVTTIEKTTGQRPRGWMGPGLTETFDTPELLAELGLRYVLDWTNDDQPYRLNVPGMLSVPYSVELNDIGIFVSKGLTGPDFARMLKDQLDQLVAEAEADGSGRVLPLALHPFVIGQAFRHRYLVEALDYITNHPAVWVTTSDDIADHYVRSRA